MMRYPCFQRLRRSPVVFLLLCCSLFCPEPAQAEVVAVRHPEGLVRGFLVLHTLEGELVAEGDLIQTSQGSRVTSELLFHFKDGSVHDETAVFSHRRAFRLLSYHLVQKGPAFKQPMEVSFNASAGQVTVHYSEDGKEKVATERLKLPPDVANGLVLTLLKNIDPTTAVTVSMVAATPKPRLVKLAIASQGEESFSTGSVKRKATHYVVKVEIGGIAGLLAPVLGKQPPDTHVWILQGQAPAFVKSEGPLYLGGPIWRIELTSPVWPHAASPESKDEAGADANLPRAGRN